MVEIGVVHLFFFISHQAVPLCYVEISKLDVKFTIAIKGSPLVLYPNASIQSTLSVFQQSLTFVFCWWVPFCLHTLLPTQWCIPVLFCFRSAYMYLYCIFIYYFMSFNHWNTVLSSGTAEAIKTDEKLCHRDISIVSHTDLRQDYRGCRVTSHGLRHTSGTPRECIWWTSGHIDQLNTAMIREWGPHTSTWDMGVWCWWVHPLITILLVCCACFNYVASIHCM